MVKIYIINLLDRKDRLKNTLNELKKVGVTPEQIHVIKAVDTRHSDYDDLRERFPEIKEDNLAAVRNGVRSEHWQLTSGSCGCFYSHLKAWKTIIKDSKHKSEPSIIMEDDIRIPNYYRARDILCDPSSKHIRKNLQSWDILLYGHTGLMRDHEQLRDKVCHKYPEVVKTNWFMGLQCYAITKQMAEQLLEHIGVPERQIDWQISDVAQAKGWSIGAFVHRLVKVTDLDSDVQLSQPCAKQW